MPRDLGTASCVIWESCAISPSEPPVSLTERTERARVRGAELARTPGAAQGPSTETLLSQMPFYVLLFVQSTSLS